VTWELYDATLSHLKLTECRGPVVPGSNLGSEKSYPDLDFSSFSSVPPGKYWDSTLKLGSDRFHLPTIL
jgi:hypothetical protein